MPSLPTLGTQSTPFQGREIPISAVPKLLRINVFILQGVLPGVLCIVFADILSRHSASSLDLVVFMFSILGVTLLAAVVTVISRSIVLNQAITCIVTVGFCLWWLGQPTGLPYFCTTIIFIILLLFRMKRMWNQSSAVDANRNSYYHDAILLLVLTPILALSQTSGNQTAFTQMLNQSFNWMLVAYLLTRLACMWNLERLESRLNRKLRYLWVLIVSLAFLFVAVLIPFVRTFIYVLIAASAAGGLLGAMLSLFIPHPHPNVHRAISSSQQSPIHHFVISPPSQANAHIGVWVGLAIIIPMLLLVWFLLRNKGKIRRSQDNQVIVHDVPSTRRWVKVSNHLKFVETDHPIRLKYQLWVKDLLRKRQPIRTQDSPSDILRKYGNVTMNETMLAEYQRIRYERSSEGHGQTDVSLE